MDQILNNEHWTEEKKISLLSSLAMTIGFDENESDLFLIEVAIEDIIENLRIIAAQETKIRNRRLKYNKILELTSTTFDWNEDKQKTIISEIHAAAICD